MNGLDFGNELRKLNGIHSIHSRPLHERSGIDDDAIIVTTVDTLLVERLE
jgi:hypothetical protein